MPAAWFRLRADIRSRWREVVAVSLLLGVAGGVVIASAAGARRTSTALHRIVLKERGADVAVNPDETPDTAKWAKLDGLPNVVSSELLRGVYVVPVDATGAPLRDEANFNITVVDVEGRQFRELERYHFTAGRMYDPRRDDEIIVNEVAARALHLRVGDTVPYGAFTEQQTREFEESNRTKVPKPQFVVRERVVGIATSLDDVSRASDDPQRSGAISFTPAFGERTASYGSPYQVKLIRLRHGAKDVHAFEAAVQQTLGGNILFQERHLTEARVRRAERPYVVALVVFAALGAIALIAVAGQVIARTRRTLVAERDTLVALGFTPREVQRLGMMRAGIIGGLGALIAIVVAIALSPIFPLGPLHSLDPTRGFDLDPLVIGIGVLVLVMVALIAGALWVENRVVNRRSILPPVITASGAPVEFATGVRFVFDRGRDASVPLVSTLLGVTVALAALLATVTYGHALTQFTHEPTRYGWPWDAQVVFHTPDGAKPDVAGMSAVIARQPGVAGTTAGALSQFDIGGRSVAALGIDPAVGVPSVPLLRGRAAQRDDEIVLGATTMSALHAHLDDNIEVRVQQRSARFHVVGVAVFARFAPYPTSEPTGLGIGAATTAKAIANLDGVLGESFILVAARPGSHVQPSTLQHALDATGLSTSVLGPQRPNDVQSYDRVTRTPLLLAGLLAVLAAGSATHLLVTGVRARRRDLAVLKTIGFTRAQARRTVLVQATTLACLALTVAVPVGVLAGRAFWVVSAHALGIADDTVVPVFGAIAVVLIAIVVANLIALVPARTAAQVRPAVALRTE